MVAVGGLTRLTRSGLSIVEWRPITGVIPPLTEEQWQGELQKYRQTPEYQKVNKGMSVEEFKDIYWWEYGHRLLGRVIGLAFALPLVFFVWRRQVSGSLAGKLVIALVLGGGQGFLGWIMVKSGLVDLPRVNHYKLAAHLSLALFLMGFLFWIAQDLRAASSKRRVTGLLPMLSVSFLILVCVQIFYGALTAGLRAGHMYNTFPTMHGSWIPQGIGSFGPIRDFFENPVTVQFMHRMLGWLTLLSSLVLGWLAYRSREINARQRLSLGLVVGMVLIQFTLGVLTLLHAVPVNLGSMHQIGACVLLLLALNNVHVFFRGAESRLRAELLRFGNSSR
jgi:cytochrome c oxidase assembly protein subunit 15